MTASLDPMHPDPMHPDLNSILNESLGELVQAILAHSYQRRGWRVLVNYGIHTHHTRLQKFTASLVAGEKTALKLCNRHCQSPTYVCI